MANYATQRTQGYGVRRGAGWSRQPIEDGVTISCTTAMIDNTNDSIELFWLPKGAVILGVVASASDMDSNGSPTLAFNIGDSGSNSRLMVATAVGQAGTLSSTLAPTGHMYKYTADTKLVAYVSTAAATAVAGTLTVSVRYFVDEGFSATNAVVS
jgi:hypothetical protein